LTGDARNLPGSYFPYSNPFANTSSSTPERWSGDSGQRARFIQDPEMLVVDDPRNRSADQIRQVIDYFNVADRSNARYQPTSTQTFCNIFATDVMRALRAPLPHWVGTSEQNANAMFDWLSNVANGWRAVTADIAVAAANLGIPSLASWKNTSGIGHIAVVRPSEPNDSQATSNPRIAQAGLTNFVNDRVSVGFGGRTPRYFIYDQFNIVRA
jgi:hypothetical protein